MKKDLSKRQLSEQEKINWIRLSRSESIGPATFFRILKIFPDINQAIEKVPEFLTNAKTRKKVVLCDLSLIEKEIESCKKFGAEILTFVDEDYPRLVREIYDPAPVLTVKGDKKLLNQDAVSIVGPRNASFHACKFAEKIAADVAKNDVKIVSGLARGIDAAAHRGSLKDGTLAVIAGGISNIYPAENRNLFEKISEQGILITEQPFGAKPRGSNFIQRNRLISGIGYGVVVVEAGVQSGSLATARFAMDQGREIFAVPGFPDDERARGSNMLIAQGAVFTVDYRDVLDEIPRLRRNFSETGILKEPESVDFIGFEPRFPSDADLKEVRQEIQSRVGVVPISVEEIIAQIGATARLVNIALVQLELSDEITINYGKIVSKI